MSPTDKLTILFLAANPGDTSPLLLDEEMRAIDRALRETEYRDRFDLRSHWALRYDDLPGLLLRYKPHIVHFSGHGSPGGELAFSDDTGKSHLVPPATLADLFHILRSNIRCVVLNACYSEQQAKGIVKSIDCVVGMKRAVADEAATKFAAGFYLGLGYGSSVATAFALGRNLMGAYVDNEEKTPKLLDPLQVADILFLAGTAAPSNALPNTPAAPAPTSAVPASTSAVPSIKQVPPLRELKGQQLQAAMNALLAAYPSENDLTQMVQIGLGENLAVIIGGGNTRTIVFNLLQWAQMRGRLTELLQAALDNNPGSPQLQEFIASLP